MQCEAELPGCWVLLQCGIDPEEGWMMTSSMLNPCQTNWTKRALKRRLLGVSLSPCFGRLCLHVAVALAWLLRHFPSSKSSGLLTLFSLNYLANWCQESSQVRWRACHAWLGFGTLSLCLLHLFLFFLLLFPRDARYPSQLLKEVSLIGRHWSGTSRLLSPASVWDWSFNLRKDGLRHHRC